MERLLFLPNLELVHIQGIRELARSVFLSWRFEPILLGWTGEYQRDSSEKLSRNIS
jgi:hypothetical protein